MTLRLPEKHTIIKMMMEARNPLKLNLKMIVFVPNIPDVDLLEEDVTSYMRELDGLI